MSLRSWPEGAPGKMESRMHTAICATSTSVQATAPREMLAGMPMADFVFSSPAVETTLQIPPISGPKGPMRTYTLLIEVWSACEVN